MALRAGASVRCLRPGSILCSRIRLPGSVTYRENALDAGVGCGGVMRLRLTSRVALRCVAARVESERPYPGAVLGAQHEWVVGFEDFGVQDRAVVAEVLDVPYGRVLEFGNDGVGAVHVRAEQVLDQS